MDIRGASLTNNLSGNVLTRGLSLANQKPKTDNTTSPENLNADVVSISKTANQLNEAETKTKTKNDGDSESISKKPDHSQSDSTKRAEQNQSPNQSTQLSKEDLKQVQALKQRDQEVRNHEAAHLAAAGKYATGGASYEYKRGADGKNYAVGGEVSIDTSPIPDNPQATLQKAQQIRAAAQAPANPSAQDRQVAASATQMEAKSRQEIAALSLNKQFLDKSTGENKDNTIDADSENPKTNDTNTNANNTENNKTASAYTAVNDISMNQNDVASLINLTA